MPYLHAVLALGLQPIGGTLVSVEAAGGAHFVALAALFLLHRRRRHVLQCRALALLALALQLVGGMLVAIKLVCRLHLHQVRSWKVGSLQCLTCNVTTREGGHAKRQVSSRPLLHSVPGGTCCTASPTAGRHSTLPVQPGLGPPAAHGCTFSGTGRPADGVRGRAGQPGFSTVETSDEDRTDWYAAARGMPAYRSAEERQHGMKQAVCNIAPARTAGT